MRCICNTYAIKAFCLENMTINSVQFSPSSGTSSIYAPWKVCKLRRIWYKWMNEWMSYILWNWHRLPNPIAMNRIEPNSMVIVWDWITHKKSKVEKKARYSNETQFSLHILVLSSVVVSFKYFAMQNMQKEVRNDVMQSSK